MKLVQFKKDIVSVDCAVVVLIWIWICLNIPCGFCTKKNGTLETKNMTLDTNQKSSVIKNNIHNIFQDTHRQLISSKSRKIIIKRALPQRYHNAYYNKRNRFNRIKYNPSEYTEYDYDYLTAEKLRNRRRNQRRPVKFDEYHYDDYDYEQGFSKWKQQQRRNRNKYRIKNNNFNYYSSENLNDTIEHVTMIIKPRQQQQTMNPTTTTELTTMPSATNITNGTTQSTTIPNNTKAYTGYGYGPSNSNDNISITYGPPSIPKPIYGIPGSAPGIPISSWSSIHHNLFGYPHYTSDYHTSYQPPSSLYKHPIYKHNGIPSGNQANYAIPYSFSDMKYDISDNYESYSRTKPYHYRQHDTSDVARENDVYPIVSRVVQTDY